MNNSLFYEDDDITNNLRFIESTEKIYFKLMAGILWLILAFLGIIGTSF